ncbi:MAG: FeoA family protein [Eubacteriales bacterium]
MTLAEGTAEKQYKVLSFDTNDEEMESFLLSLGCYQGETIGLIGVRGKNYTVSIRDGRYTIDKNLAEAITVELISA